MAKVCVALSGGVDSAVTAYLLQQEGHDVHAAFIKVWQPDFLPCSQEEDRVSAKRVAASLGIPFYVVDLSTEYKNGIVDYMVESYRHGETPNPDVLCNKIIKFGALWEWAQAHGFTHIATGHHARVVQCDDGVARLMRGVDAAKDQSYFVWQIPESILASTYMPVGHMQKKDVRAIAERAGLAVATRKDSQGLCFLGMITMSDFLDHFIDQKEGVVLDAQGSAIGTHTGAHRYTIGERHGFIVSGNQKPLYVTSISIPDNTITVSEHVTEAQHRVITLRDCVFREAPDGLCTAQVRYHGEHMDVTVTKGAQTVVHFSEPVTVSAGQSCVIYRNDVCIGGGIVTTSNL